MASEKLRMSFLFLALAAFVMLLGVAMGAFGAHGLRNILSDQSLIIYQTAVSYQMWHGLGLGLIAAFSQHLPHSKLLIWAGWLMFVGVILFSGSLYILSLTGIRWLGAITPFGGLAFLIAWGLVLFYGLHSRRNLS